MAESLPIGSPDLLVSIVILLICIAVVAFFSSSEASLISVSKIRIRRLAERGNKQAQAAMRIVANHDKLFGTILLTENAFIILASSIGTALAVTILGPGETGIIAATLIMTVLIVMFGEITPKTFAAGNAERFSLAIARPIEMIIRLLSPVIHVFIFVPNVIIGLIGGRMRHRSPFVTRDEIKMQIDDGLKEGTVEEIEHEILDNVFKFGQRHASEVMVPRPDLVGIEHAATFGDFLDLYAESPHTFYPAYEESMDNIMGIISAKDALTALAKASLTRTNSVESLIRPAHFFPETKPLGELFTEMQAKRIQLAVVIDEFGGTAGLVTLKELAAEMVGSLSDASEGESQKVREIDGKTFEVDASLRVEEINEQLALSLPPGDYDTIAGFILNELGHIPQEGEELSPQGLRLTVSQMHGVKIEKLLLVKE
ncbi:MAG: HlyC/CorC family transporter [Chloroflexi bacterium]|nr:HlyC/CorC family transporter [Chloroflexota bacterium]